MYSETLEKCLLSSYERILRQALETTDTIMGYVNKVQDFKYANFVPKYMEYTFCDMQLKFVHQAFAKHLTKLMMPYLSVPLEHQEKHVSHDMTLYSIIPYDLHGSFFMQVIQNAIKEFEAGSQPKSDGNLKLLRFALYQTINLEKFQELVDTHKSQIASLYEDMGAGITYTPTDEDTPRRLCLLT